MAALEHSVAARTAQAPYARVKEYLKQGLVAGRCVWTDENGDQVFSRVKGEPLGTGKRLAGTITGGTGRYAGLEGEYSLVWQYVVRGEDGRVQARAAKLTGQVRQGSPQP